MQGTATKIMTTEQLISKKVKHHFDGQKVLFDVISLEEHFSGLNMHKSDIQLLEKGELVITCIKHEDIDFNSATPKEVEPEEDFTIGIGETILEEKHFEVYTDLKENGYEVGDVLLYEEGKPWSKKVTKLGMLFEEAEIILNNGGLVALPEWEGFWFKNLLNLELLVFTKDGKILDTPNEEFKLYTDWIEVEANEEQSNTLQQYFDNLKAKSIEVLGPIIETGKENNAITDNTEELKKEDTKTSARKDFEAKTTNKK